MLTVIYVWVMGPLVGEFVFPLVSSQMVYNEHGVFQNLVYPPCYQPPQALESWKWYGLESHLGPKHIQSHHAL